MRASEQSLRPPELRDDDDAGQPSTVPTSEGGNGKADQRGDAVAKPSSGPH
jgi:hypothetical protein